MDITKMELLEKIVDEMPYGVYCVDTERTIFFWNKAAERISGYSVNEMKGRHCFEGGLDHIDEEGIHLCQTMCPLVATIFDGQSREKVVWLKNREGKRVSVLVHTEPLYQDGATIGAIEYFRKV